ncbi:class I SAM-dependent methyltransferase [Devosia sp. RR2S18]|uniref:class I SAM-dependent methyltransferase n=1 Tax=Devosia rhizosphaerae TaxID=3049774 RepID=UPI00253FEE54|nr:class I SAM-dependent methyltransferase [Devosia sp. RR2S18]WIJ26449.1 class I SAM-dependent methyltransferase [Devosia sp. RR2S18]
MLALGAAREALHRKEHWVSLLTSGMVRYITEQFQFVDLRGQIASLRQIYRDFLEHLAEEPEEAVERHHGRLLEWTRTQLAVVGALELVRGTGFRPVCSNYSPELQLQVLGIRSEEIKEPVLDLGCGDGSLVRYLCDRGLTATGIDRNAPDGLLSGEWFDAPLGSGQWGTIIAHQSVSLHFRSAHHASASRASDYARLYLRILHALRPGGRFLYAPSLPFFEHVLPSEFLVSHSSAFPGAESTMVTRI